MGGDVRVTNAVVLGMEAVAALLAVLFVVYYIRILARGRDAGPEPLSWIVAAVGVSLVASAAVLETVLAFRPAPVVFNIQRVYFMLGNMILAGVLYRVWRGMGGSGGW